MLLDTVLNAQTSAGTALFDTVTLHTDDPGSTGLNEDTGITEESVTWSAPSGGVSTASATFEDITGEWWGIGLHNSGTFVASVQFPNPVTYSVAADLTVALRFQVAE